MLLLSKLLHMRRCEPWCHPTVFAVERDVVRGQLRSRRQKHVLSRTTIPGCSMGGGCGKLDGEAGFTWTVLLMACTFFTQRIAGTHLHPELCTAFTNGWSRG